MNFWVGLKKAEKFMDMLTTRGSVAAGNALPGLMLFSRPDDSCDTLGDCSIKSCSRSHPLGRNLASSLQILCSLAMLKKPYKLACWEPSVVHAHLCWRTSPALLQLQRMLQ